MKFKVPGQNITVVASSQQMGVIETDPLGNVLRQDMSNVHPAVVPTVKAVSVAVAATAVGTAALTCGAPAVVAAGCSAAVRPLVSVGGYYREDGTYVRGHNRTWPDCTEANNFS